jgi:hypothetical protein
MPAVYTLSASLATHLRDCTLGYTLENADDLANVLKYSRTLINEATKKTVTQFGTKFELTLKVIGANGREGFIEVVWQVDHGTSLYRLITAIARPFRELL